MPYDFSKLGLREMTTLGAALRQVGANADSMEEVGQRVAKLLYDGFIDEAASTRACALVRFYVTTTYGDLDEDLRAFGAKLAPRDMLTPETRCMTLLATVGDKPEWNSRKSSLGHKTIPLPTEHAVRSIPMVSQLITQLGIDVGAVVAPDRSLVLEQEQRTYNVFFVPHALGSPYIPAQDDFVVPCGIRSVLGFGGLLPSTDVYAVLMFSRAPITRAVADLFRNAAMNLKVALLPFIERPFLGSPGYAGQ